MGTKYFIFFTLTFPRAEINSIIAKEHFGVTRNEIKEMIYKAFMSYSHTAAGTLAPTVHSALHHLAKPIASG